MANVSFLVPSISGPVLGPVIVLGKNLAKHHNVQIIGPDLGQGVCPMYEGYYDYTVVPTPRIYRYPDYRKECRKLGEAISGDIIFAVKAASTTIPVALQVKRARGARVVAYLDEWDGALYKRLSMGERLGRWAKHWQHPGDEIYIPRIERMIPQLDEVTSTTTFLQKKFGGRVLHMGVDTSFFQPVSNEHVSSLRKDLGLEGKSLTVFGGVVRPHKGIELILDALVELNRTEVQLLIVGPETEHVHALRARADYAPYLVCAGAQPKERMPEFLSLADMIVLPLLDDLLARSQMPCKVFEAMSMARPIITSAISDLPEVLKECGMVVPAGQSTPIAVKMAEILADPEAAKDMGDRAREKCISLYSQEHTEQELLDIVAQLS